MLPFNMILRHYLAFIFFLLLIGIDAKAQTLNNFYSLPGSSLDAKRVIQTPDGGFIFIGTQDVGASGDWANFNFSVTKITATGTITWSKTYDYALTAGTTADLTGSIIATTYATTAGYIITGTTVPIPYGTYGADGLVMKLDLNGNLLWVKRFSNNIDSPTGGYSYDSHTNAFELADKSLAIAISYNGDNGVLRLDENGNFLNGTGLASSIVTNAAGSPPYNIYSGEDVTDACLTNSNNNLVEVGRVDLDSTTTL
ncbi:MAG TPA: hypothetical protein VF691_08410, partial [Cytophagaceae bacterium]